MDGASSSANPAQLPQKRVLPARSRGAPVVGNCDIDLMILDRQKRRLEYDPLIPAETQLLLTTNPRTVEKSFSTQELGLNVHANDRYFGQLETRAYKQGDIETPEYSNISKNPAAMGRLRPRNSEDGTADTSDAAYEKRHRKYEAFEKRIRLREKEKLKHEQYKLKQRIEQLRALDGGAFLSLPASSFSPAPGQHNGDSEDSRSAHPGIRINNTAAYNEGERRRKEMLDVASCLEERYRILLPPDRFRKAPSNISTPVEPEGVVYMTRRYDTEPDEEPLVEAGHETEKMKQSESLKPKHRLKGKATRGRPPKKRKKSLSPVLEPASPIRANDEPIEPVSSAPNAIDHEPTPVLSSPSPRSEASSRSATPISNPEIAVLQSNDRDVTPAPREEESDGDSDVPPSAVASPAPPVASSATSPNSVVLSEGQAIPARRGRKRIKLSSPPPPSTSRKATRATSVPPIESMSPPAPRGVGRPQKQHVSYAGAAGKTERTKSVLVVTASRKSESSTRKTGRHVSIFGMKITNDLFPPSQEKDYVIPTWVLGS